MRIQSELGTETGAPLPGQHLIPSSRGDPPTKTSPTTTQDPLTRSRCACIAYHWLLDALSTRAPGSCEFRMEFRRSTATLHVSHVSRMYLQAGNEPMSFQNPSNQLILMRLN